MLEVDLAVGELLHAVEKRGRSAPWQPIMSQFSSDWWMGAAERDPHAIHESLLACDIVGMHTPRYVHAFLDCVEAFTDGEVDVEQPRPCRGQDREIRSALPDLGRPGASSSGWRRRPR